MTPLWTHLRAGAAATTGLLLGALAIAVAVALVTAPLTPRLAVAQTASKPNDQPTARTLPRGYDPAHESTGSVRPPRSMKPSTEVIPSDGNRVDPLDHLSPE